MAGKFARLYYQNGPPEDILREDRENLYGAAVGLYQFAAHRPAAGPKIRIFNPTHDEHGWHTRHSVVEIVNDDMPILVDSVTAALNGFGITVHLVLHPVMRVDRKSVGWGKCVSVRRDFGGSRRLRNKKKKKS